jgi:hypothetical protein
MKSPAEMAGHQLFTGADDWWHNACLNWAPFKWDYYATGYKSAADLLVENTMTSRAHLDTHVFPIVFLYRQYLELRLKELVVSGRSLVDRSGKQKLDHKLEPLWAELRGIIEHVWPDEGPEDLDAIQDYIAQFSAVDPTSTAFRYPTAKDGSPSLPDVRHINLRQLYLVMASVAQLLEGVSSAIDVYLGYKRDMEADGYGH